ncbi:MAG: class II glutamine amidotransferase [Candidatus Hydrogenedens sp.]
MIICRLLGVIANKSVSFGFSFRKFKEFGEKNPHGWGVGWYDSSGKANIRKEGCFSKKSKIYDDISDVHSHLIIEHVQYRTTGSVCEENAHPFIFANWIFAHNGFIDHDSLYEEIEPDYRTGLRKDCTDSEVYFRFLLQNINKQNGDTILGIRNGLKEIIGSNNYGSLNFLLSNGQYLYAYRNGMELSMLKRFYVNPHGNKEFQALSKETQFLIKSKSLNREKAVVICSESISDEAN